MAAYKLLDFSDIYTAIMEELKLQSSDTVSLNRIKRMVNMIYLDEVIPATRWWWLNGYTSVMHKAYYAGGTASVTPLSTTVTLSVAPASTDGDSGSFYNYCFSVDQTNEIYKISAHTALSTTVTLDRAFNGTLNATASFKIWREELDMPTDFRESVSVWHDQRSTPMEAKGIQEFRKLVGLQPKVEGRPICYSTYDYRDPSTDAAETENDRYRVIKVYPAISQYSTIVKVDYIKEASALDVAGDEPLMPLEDRIVLFYGGLSLAWGSIGRNPEEAMRNRQLFEGKLSRMMGKIQDSLDKPRFEPESKYVNNMRGNRIRGVARSTAGFAGGQSTYNAPTYLSNTTINGATITGNVTVSSGITIDGRDISVDGATLDAHLVDTTDAHAASAIGVTASGNLSSTNVQSALSELQGDIDLINTLADGKIYVGNASNVATEVTPSGDVTMDNTGVTAITAGVIVDADVNASAAIALSKLATTTASRALESTAGGVISPSAVTSTELGYVSGVTSAIQTQLNAKAPTASPTFTGTITTPLTASRAVVTGASSELAASAATATEVGYLSGVTSAIQTQIAARALAANPAFTGTLSSSVEADTTAGANQTLGTPTAFIKRCTGALTSVGGMTAPAITQYAIFMNVTGSSCTIVNEYASATAADRIITGTGQDLIVADKASVWLVYDLTTARWRVVGGSGSGGTLSVTTQTASTYTVLAGDNVVVCNPSAAMTVTLHTAVGYSGKQVVIKNISTYTITLATTSSQTIDDATGYSITSQYGALTLVSDNANWHIV